VDRLLTAEPPPSSRATQRWGVAFAAAVFGWAVLLPLAPFAAHGPHDSALLSGVIYSVYAIGGIICHQMPARSFHLWATPMPVCARCTGIYLGAAVTVALSLALRRGPSVSGAGGRPGRSAARIALGCGVIPTLATLIYEWTTGDTPANWIRALAGVPIGAAVAWIIREVN
jgi:multisubunit Na+/H+ antiporter MnhB subunit